jgi:hypothetical protein
MSQSTRCLQTVRGRFWGAALGIAILGMFYCHGAASISAACSANKTKIVFIAGPASHDYGQHEFFAGCTLLSEWFYGAFPNIETVVCRNGWPKNPKVFDGAAAIVIFADGGDKKNPMLPHLDQIDKLMKRGVGMACLHYALNVPKGRPGDLMKDWLGGYYEMFWTVAPFWTPEFKTFPDHPVARGVKPVALWDEWDFHLRFIDSMEGVTPILTDVPPDSARMGTDGPHSGNPTVRAEND